MHKKNRRPKTSNPVDQILEAREIVARDRERSKSQSRIAELEASKRALLKELEQADARLGVIQALQDSTPPEVITPKLPQTSHEATAVLLCSDWHVGERVDPATAQGRNRYDPRIAKQRADALIEGFLWHIETLRSGPCGYGWGISDIVIWLGGDIITGYIHEELRESNTLSPTEEVIFATQLIQRLLETVAAHPGVDSVIVPCSYGNHGRTEIKKRISTGAKNSFEWLMYQMLSQRYADHPKIRFIVSGGEVMTLKVYGHTLRFTHGDLYGLRYGGGVGGITIPIKKYVMRENENLSAAVTCFGHFHQFVDEARFIVNNCMIGYGPLSQSLGAPHTPPSQVMFLMDRKRGKKLATEIYL